MRSRTGRTARTAWRRRPLSRYVLLFIALLAVGGFYAGIDHSPSAEAANAPSKDQIAEGKRLFETNCATCHGMSGQGTKSGPSLYGAGAAAVDFQVGTGRMPLAQPGAQAPRKEPRFTQKQIDAMAAYVQSLSPGPEQPKNVDEYENADLPLGGELFRANCAQCHNFAGSGGALTNGKYAPELTGVEPKHIYEAMETGPENMPVFGERTLTPDEKLAIIRYIKAIEEEPNPGGHGLGRIGPVSEGLVVWLIGMGLCVVSAMWIVAKKKTD